MPYKNKPKSKERPVIVVDMNDQEELVIIPTSTKTNKNTSHFGKYGIKRYRHNIEIEDNEQQPIKINNKFKFTDKCTKLPEVEARKIATKVIYHTKMSSENKKKYNRFKNRHKKTRD